MEFLDFVLVQLYIFFFLFSIQLSAVTKLHLFYSTNLFSVIFVVKKKLKYGLAITKPYLALFNDYSKKCKKDINEKEQQVCQKYLQLSIFSVKAFENKVKYEIVFFYTCCALEILTNIIKTFYLKIVLQRRCTTH